MSAEDLWQSLRNREGADSQAALTELDNSSSSDENRPAQDLFRCPECHFLSKGTTCRSSDSGDRCSYEVSKESHAAHKMTMMHHQATQTTGAQYAEEAEVWNAAAIRHLQAVEDGEEWSWGREVNLSKRSLEEEDSPADTQLNKPVELAAAVGGYMGTCTRSIGDVDSLDGTQPNEHTEPAAPARASVDNRKRLFEESGRFEASPLKKHTGSVAPVVRSRSPQPMLVKFVPKPSMTTQLADASSSDTLPVVISLDSQEADETEPIQWIQRSDGIGPMWPVRRKGRFYVEVPVEDFDSPNEQEVGSKMKKEKEEKEKEARNEASIGASQASLEDPLMPASVEECKNCGKINCSWLEEGCGPWWLEKNGQEEAEEEEEEEKDDEPEQEELEATHNEEENSNLIGQCLPTEIKQEVTHEDKATDESWLAIQSMKKEYGKEERTSKEEEPKESLHSTEQQDDTWNEDCQPPEDHPYWTQISTKDEDEAMEPTNDDALLALKNEIDEELHHAETKSNSQHAEDPDEDRLGQSWLRAVQQQEEDAKLQEAQEKIEAEKRRAKRKERTDWERKYAEKNDLREALHDAMWLEAREKMGYRGVQRMKEIRNFISRATCSRERLLGGEADWVRTWYKRTLVLSWRRAGWKWSKKSVTNLAEVDEAVHWTQVGPAYELANYDDVRFGKWMELAITATGRIVDADLAAEMEVEKRLLGVASTDI